MDRGLTMRPKILFTALLMSALCVSSALAGSGLRIGTAGGQELLIPVGSRGTAMGGTVVASTYGLESIFWNPAGLASLEGTEAMFSHQPYIADIDVNFGGIATAIEGFGTIAASAKIVSIGEMMETTEAETKGTGRTFNPTLSVLGLTYARQMTASVGFGATAMFISETIDQVSAKGLAFDVGFLYDPRWKGVSIGLAIKNYGPSMKFTGKGFERRPENEQRALAGEAASFDLPSHITLGAAWNALNQGRNAVTLAGTFRSNNFSEDQWQGGAEYSYNDRYFLRGGYNYSSQENYIYGASFGAGLSYPMGETVLSFEYAWSQADVFDDNQYFTFKVNF